MHDLAAAPTLTETSASAMKRSASIAASLASVCGSHSKTALPGNGLPADALRGLGLGSDRIGSDRIGAEPLAAVGATPDQTEALFPGSKPPAELGAPLGARTDGRNDGASDARGESIEGWERGAILCDSLEEVRSRRRGQRRRGPPPPLIHNATPLPALTHSQVIALAWARSGSRRRRRFTCSLAPPPATGDDDGTDDGGTDGGTDSGSTIDGDCEGRGARHLCEVTCRSRTFSHLRSPSDLLRSPPSPFEPF